MKQVTVNKKDLLEKLKENRKLHKKLVWEAQEGFKIAAKKKLEQLLEKVNKNEMVDFRKLYELDQPMDQTKEYDRAIEMLEMEVNETVVVTANEFRSFVQDNWDWTDSMLLSNTKYLSR